VRDFLFHVQSGFRFFFNCGKEKIVDQSFFLEFFKKMKFSFFIRRCKGRGVRVFLSHFVNFLLFVIFFLLKGVQVFFKVIKFFLLLKGGRRHEVFSFTHMILSLHSQGCKQ